MIDEEKSELIMMMLRLVRVCNRQQAAIRAIIESDPRKVNKDLEEAAKEIDILLDNLQEFMKLDRSK
jgi:predicted translin family RNA/ssDNA-binding protein